VAVVTRQRVFAQPKSELANQFWRRSHGIGKASRPEVRNARPQPPLFPACAIAERTKLNHTVSSKHIIGYDRLMSVACLFALLMCCSMACARQHQEKSAKMDNGGGGSATKTGPPSESQGKTANTPATISWGEGNFPITGGNWQLTQMRPGEGSHRETKAK